MSQSELRTCVFASLFLQLSVQPFEMDEHCLEIQKCSESRWLHHWVIAIGLLIHLAHWKRYETPMLARLGDLFAELLFGFSEVWMH